MKIIKIWDFLNQDENKSRPNFPNIDHETRKQKQKDVMCETKIQQGFITKNNQNKVMIRKSYPKLALNKQKVMGNYTSTYTPWHLTQRSFSKSFQST
jgi:hypothetical protein